MNTPPIQRIDLEKDEIPTLLERARASLDADDYAKLKALVETAVYLLEVVEDQRTTLDRLRKLLFGPNREKTRDVLETRRHDAAAPDRAEPAGPTAPPSQPTPLTPGHGRHGADDYGGAEKVPVPHPTLHGGDPCPECQKGRVYPLAQPGVVVRITGQAPVQAQVYELQKLRCHLCGKVFTAPAPEGIGTQKHDPTSASMIALLKYGSGLPFHRLEGLQGSLGLPLPASTQWDIVHAAARRIKPAYEELIRQAAHGEVLHNDDTPMTILAWMGKRTSPEALAEETPQRQGVFTSGIVSTKEGRRIALFFTGSRHAGENLAQVLAHRAEVLGPPIQMCDALSRNRPKELKTLLAHCLAHGRRQFVDVAERFPEECRHVLEILGKVYHHDAVARERNLSAEERLQFHQTESGPLMEQLRAWCMQQFEERRVEPNSPLGEAIAYLLKHWEKLTLFLRQAGAPLDNNVCERALKKAILHRKNALFYKTQNGAHVGDLFMSLIYTSQLCGADPFHYLTELQRHAAELATHASQWMPWNYRETLIGATATPDTAR